MYNIPIDIDECASGEHDCHVNAECLNTEGTFYCTCSEGYFGSGTVCMSK